MTESKHKKGSWLDHLYKGLYDAVCQATSMAENQHIQALNKILDIVAEEFGVDPSRIRDDQNLNDEQREVVRNNYRAQ